MTSRANACIVYGEDYTTDVAGASQDESKLWHDTLEILKCQVPEPGFRTWLLNVQLRDVDVQKEILTAVLAVPSAFAAEWLRGHYECSIAAALVRCSGRPAHVRFVVEAPAKHRKLRALDGIMRNEVGAQAKSAAREDLTRGAGRSATASPATLVTAKQLGTTGASILSPRAKSAEISLLNGANTGAEYNPQPLNPKCTFEQTVVGRSNQYAISLARRMSEGEGVTHRPLFIFGPHGVGKSHLLHAIGNGSCSQRSSKVVCMPATFFESFGAVERLAQSSSKMPIDLLLVDDLHYISGAGGRDAQHRLAALIEKMLTAGTRVAITSTKPPGAMLALREDLLLCLSDATTVALGLPDLELKSKFVSSLAERAGMSIHRHALQILASTGSSFSDLTYLCERVFARHKQSRANPVQEQGMMLTAHCAREFLDEAGPNGAPGSDVEPERIVDQIAAYFDLEIEEICSSSREQKILFSRQLAMYLIRELTDRSYKWIAHRFARQDHTTAMHSCTRIAQLAASNADVRQMLLELKQMVFGEHERTHSSLLIV